MEIGQGNVEGVWEEVGVSMIRMLYVCLQDFQRIDRGYS